jgi:KDO2-lipid IV(A) lauroyltransferase
VNIDKYVRSKEFMTTLFWLVSRLPIAWAQAVGALVGTLIARLPGRYGQRLRDNYRHAFPDSTEHDITQASRSAGRMMMEMPYFWMRKNALAPLRIEPASFYEPIAGLLEKGKGVILLSPHLGGYELLGPLFAQHGPCTVLFKPPRNAYLKTWVEKMRAGPDLIMAPANFKGVRMLLKALRRGEVIGILPDQCPPGGEGEWASFFGRPAYTMTLVQKLQAQTGASIVFVCAQRLGPGHFRIHVEPLPDRLPGCPLAATLSLNQHLERLIRLAPDQYLWGYNRYRRPSGAVAAPVI